MSGRKRKRGCQGSMMIMLFLFVFMMSGIGILRKLRDSSLADTSNVPYQKVELKEEQCDGKYYYESLQEEELQIYREILQGLLDETESITLHSRDADQTNKLFQFVLNDYPEIFWCDGQGEAALYQSEEESYIVFTPLYQYRAEVLEQKKQEINVAAEEILKDLPTDGTEYDKIKYIYETIINRTEYQESAPDNQNIYSVLVNGKSVCAGYARTAQYLLEQAGVFCTYVTGMALRPETSEQIPHAWNIVRCEGEYYHMDTTWGDPLYLQGAENTLIYDYLCTNDEELFRTHTMDTAVTFPQCTSLTYNYYVLNGMYYSEYESEQFFNVMKNAISNGERQVIFKFADTVLYQTAKENMINETVKEAAEYLGRQYQLTTVSYSWQEDDLLNKLTVMWNYE